MMNFAFVAALLLGAPQDRSFDARLPALAQDRKAPELDGGVGWLNTDKPLKLADLKGKIVLLDFWTYC